MHSLYIGTIFIPFLCSEGQTESCMCAPPHGMSPSHSMLKGLTDPRFQFQLMSQIQIWDDMCDNNGMNMDPLSIDMLGMDI
jgi:hypothetical protein